MPKQKSSQRNSEKNIMENNQNPATGSFQNLFLEIANLEIDAKIGKDRHFSAATRKNNLRIALGLFSVSGTAIIASKAIKDLFSAFPLISPYETILISVISLLVGLSTAVLGFLGLEKQVEQHRRAGNLYIEIARKSRRLINKLRDTQDKEAVTTDLDKLLSEYISINKETESCPTSPKDSISSIEQNAQSRKIIKDKIKEIDKSIIGEPTKKAPLSLKKLIIKKIKITIANAALKAKLLKPEDLDKYINSL